MQEPDKFEKVNELAKRRGFFWPSYDLYGGVSGFIDYGPTGALMKRKIERKWLDTFVLHEGLQLIDTPLITPKIVFDASGHTKNFTDPVTTCEKCSRKWRADHLLEEQAKVSAEGLSLEGLREKMQASGVRCPECKGKLKGPVLFNELFSTSIGPYSENIGFGRPETAQGIFVNFKRLYGFARNRLPFGVAQIGKCVRNEISPRQGPIRLRELTIMEFEFFFDPEQSKCGKIDRVQNELLRIVPEERLLKKRNEPLELTVAECLEKRFIKSEWAAYFMALAKRFIIELGIREEKQLFKEKLQNERAHYSAQTFDQVVELTRWGMVEVSGHALRTDYDLKKHSVHSGVDLQVFVQHEKPRIEGKTVIIPNKKTLGQSFKEYAQNVSRLLDFVPAEKLRVALDDDGHFDLEDDGKIFRILSSHVQIKEAEIKETGRRFIANVIEPSFGLDRLFYAALEYAYAEKDERIVLQVPKSIAPFDAAVFPLVSKDGLPERANELTAELVDHGYNVECDDSGSIGHRYARADEIGIPIAVTVDYDTMKDSTVTLRDRDTWTQIRAPSAKLIELFDRYFKSNDSFTELFKV